MKKFICLLLGIVIFFVSTSAFAEPFTVHNGIPFGATPDEIIEYESQNGFEFSERILVSSDNKLFEEGTFFLECLNVMAAGEEGSDIYYLFDNSKKMSSCLYYADDFLDPFDSTNVLSTLIEKYGEPVAYDTEYISIGKSQDALSTYNTFCKSFEMADIEIDEFYQWLIETEDGGVEIMVLSFSRSFFVDSYHRVISYSHITSEEWDEMIGKVKEAAESVNSDL